MNKCIMCGAEVFKDIGYVTDGKIFVCDRCAESHSLTRIITRIENSGCDSNLKSCYSASINTGLVDQTKPQGYIPDCPFHPCDTCHFYYGEIDSCMVGEYRYTPTDEEREKLIAVYGEARANDFFKPSFGGDITKEIANDIFSMPSAEFLSKYSDTDSALVAYKNYNGENSLDSVRNDVPSVSEEDFVSNCIDNPDEQHSDSV